MVSLSWAPVRAFFGRFAIALVIAATITTGAVASVNHEIDTRVAKIKRIKLLTAPSPPAGENFLIIGSDSRQFEDVEAYNGNFGDPSVETGKNSDTLMVAHVEPGSQRTTVVSFPRDLVVDIRGLGMQKINAAYGTGGPQAVIDMLSDNFGIPIQHYVEVDFKTFQDVVEAIGHIYLYFPLVQKDDNTGWKVPWPGCFPLNGDAALAYVRSRSIQYSIDGQWVFADSDAPDLHRIQRQQEFIKKLAALAIQKSLGDPFLALDIADNILGDIKADSGLSRGDVNELIDAFRTVDVNDPNSVQFETIPTAPDPSAPQSRLVLADGAQAMIDQLRTFGVESPPAASVLPQQVRVRVLDGTGKGYAQDTLIKLAQNGFQQRGYGDAGRHVSETEIRYGKNQLAAAKTLLPYVADAKLVPDSSLTDTLVLVVGDTFTGLTTSPTATTLSPAPVEPAPATTAPPKHAAATTTTIEAGTECSN
jgi:LCP family protein required for cell wall assembly